jgi:hypothetical protein|tara:strand:+ start:2486 stop:3781 length:1296 start_codon:yes stop_codon:yes gene_type:complete
MLKSEKSNSKIIIVNAKNRNKLQILAQRTALSLCALFLFSSCEDIFEVVNPGPILDTALDIEQSGKTVLTGAIADVEVSANMFVLYSGVASTDMNADATRPWVQIPSTGVLLPLNDEVWAPGHLGRWSAEAAIERLTETQSAGASSPLVAAAYLWAGYANRLLGDNVCITVIDGGAPSPSNDHYTRAVAHFNSAITGAKAAGDTDIETAAIAGKAQCNLLLGNYAEAASDAGKVGDDFLFVAHRDDNSGREHNWTWSESHDQKQITAWGRYVSDSTSVDYGDPRAPYEDTQILSASGTRPFYRQKKYPERGSDIPLAKGAEMRLIEAEVLLRSGDVSGCMAKINGVRTAAGVAEKTASTESEAWLALDQERHLVLWLEARRLKDNSRLNGLSSLSTDFMSGIGFDSKLGRDECFPPSLAEISANVNITNWP